MMGADSDQDNDERNIQHSLDTLSCETLLMLNRAATNANIKSKIMPPLVQMLSSLHVRSNMTYWGEKFATDFGKSLLAKMLMVDSNMALRVGDMIVGQMETLVNRITTTMGQGQSLSHSMNTKNTAEAIADAIVLQGMFEVITTTTTATGSGGRQWDRLTKRIIRVASSCLRLGGSSSSSRDKGCVCLMISALAACHALITTQQQLADSKQQHTLASSGREVVDMCVALLNDQHRRPGLGPGLGQLPSSHSSDAIVLTKSAICLLAAAVSVCAGSRGHPLTYPFTHSLTHTHAITQSLTHPFSLSSIMHLITLTHSIILSLTHPLTYTTNGYAPLILIRPVVLQIKASSNISTSSKQSFSTD